MPRTFAPITEKEFAMRFLAVLMEDDSCHKEKITKIFQKEQDYVKTVYEYMDCDTPLYSDVFDQFFTDLDVVFCFENHHCSPRRSKILGFHTLNNGFTFLGIEAAGDWEIAVTCVMYWDGNDFRGYVPKNGNCWNHINNEAFGNDSETDWKYLKKHHPSKTMEIEQKIKKETGFFSYKEAWLAKSETYDDLVDDDKMLEEIEQVFQTSSISTSEKIEVECKKEQTNANNREKMIVEDKNGNFKLVIGYYSPTFDYDMEDDSLGLEDAIEKALEAQEPQDEDEVWGKNDYMILYNANGDILQKVDGQEIVDCICSKYGESLYEVDIMKYAIAEFLMAYYNVDIVKIDNFEYNKQEIEKRGKIKFKF